ncbi:hypothetical protein C8Q74DRAFT_683705, partial [Fomes fomentarius]
MPSTSLVTEVPTTTRVQIPSLTFPQASPTLPPRPEFKPFTVPNLCGSSLFDGIDYWMYPERHNWVVHARDKQCHVLCPPGLCWHDTNGIPEAYRLARPPMLARADGSPVTATDKVAFLQSWLFYGTLTEVSTLCGLALDIEAEFLVDNGKSVSTSSLNGLAGRWFSALPPDRFGDEVLMERILAISRYICLLLVEELTEDNHSGSTIQHMYEYTPEECRILHSIDILARTLGLHLLLHVYSPGFSASDDKAWSQKRITRSIVWMGRAVEGMDQLSDIVFDDLQERGWCVSELYLMATNELIIASLLERPRARNHPMCTDTLCHAYQTDEGTYNTVHVDETCSCDFVSVPMEDLVNVLAQGKVPAVLVTTELEVCVVHTKQYPYIALSHVWADGLGNPQDNALPKCQLRRLRDFANDLYDSQFHTLSTKQGIL